MLFIRFLVSTYYTYIVVLILLLSEIIPIYFYCTKKKLIYIIIMALFSHQLSFYFKCIKANIYFFCNMYLVSINKYIFFTFSYLFVPPHSLSVNT